MALVARMVAEEVRDLRSTVWVPTHKDDPEAVTPEEAFSNYHYGVPFWLKDHEFVRQTDGHGRQTFTMNVVRSGGPDDPNNDFCLASPMGKLEMSLDNPAGFGYIKAGETYRVTIEKIRGPRDKEQDDGEAALKGS